MYYCYILKSLKDRSYYVGSTASYEKRLERHNKGLVKSTRNKIPWELVCFESYNTRREAMKREKQIKSWKKRKYIEDLILKNK
jgi:putative endonuclease